MKEFRMNRMFNNEIICILAVDHGLSYGQIPGLESPAYLIQKMCNIGCKNVLLNKGIAFDIVRQRIKIDANYILNLSAGLNTNEIKTDKTVMTEIATALKLDAVAVAIQINFNSALSCKMLKEIGKVIDQAYKWEIPVIAMVYINDDCKVSIVDAVRIVEELGADIIKIARPNIYEEKKIIMNSNIPILLAGGVYNNKVEYDNILKNALDSGYKGLVIGRNIFQSVEPENMMKKVIRITQERNI